MSSKKWVITFICIICTIFILICGFNFVTDPFGVFGDKLFNWYSFNMTQNPRVAKIAYLDKNHEKYDSYIIGSSGTSAYSTELLNKYTGGNFYNLFFYGADMHDSYLTAKYVIENYDVKNIIINVGVMDAISYEYEGNSVTGNLHAKAEESFLPAFYFKYLSVNPRFGYSKIRDKKADTYLPQAFDVFLPESGEYDKSGRDSHPVGSLAEYLEQNPEFTEYEPNYLGLWNIDKCVSKVAEIKAMCEEKNINFTMIFSPIYEGQLPAFDMEQIEQFKYKLAEIDGFWDFSISSISEDPRYFYDITHFKNAVGEMALAKVFGDESKYAPADFGKYISKNERIVRDLWIEGKKHDEYKCELPIITYHNITDEKSDSANISKELFEKHLGQIKGMGYNTVSIKQVVDYVEKGADLPENPLLITFDDGYISNYEIAFPLLKEYNMKAVVFAIGSSVGKDTYKSTDVPITSHFTYEQAKEMVGSGVFEVQTHGFDMHQWADYEEGTARESAKKIPGENEEIFIEDFRDDFVRAFNELIENAGIKVFAYAYPKGEYDLLNSAILREMGVKATFSTVKGMNTLIKGLPQSLIGMKRNNVGGDDDVAEVLNIN